MTRLPSRILALGSPPPSVGAVSPPPTSRNNGGVPHAINQLTREAPIFIAIDHTMNPELLHHIDTVLARLGVPKVPLLVHPKDQNGVRFQLLGRFTPEFGRMTETVMLRVYRRKRAACRIRTEPLRTANRDHPITLSTGSPYAARCRSVVRSSYQEASGIEGSR